MSQKILNLLNARLKITLKDNRIFVGQLIAFDRFMNLVLNDCQETRVTASGSMEKRTLGLVILRGKQR
jgi:small nuclear ribonucleoprotein B and B'